MCLHQDARLVVTRKRRPWSLGTIGRVEDLEDVNNTNFLLTWEHWEWLLEDCSWKRSDKFFIDVLGFAGTRVQVMVILAMQHEGSNDALATGRQGSSIHEAAMKLRSPSGALHLIVYVTRSKQRGRSIFDAFHGCWADAPYPRQHALGPAIIAPFIGQDFGKDSLNFQAQFEIEAQYLAGQIIYKYKSHPQIARFLFRNTVKK